MKHCGRLHVASLALAIGLVLGVSTVPAAAQQGASEDRLAQIRKAFAESNFVAAEAAIQEELEASPGDPAMLFQLASALHSQNDLERAERAYQAAREGGFQPAARIDYHLARIKAVQGDQSAALDFLESMAKTSGPIASTVQQTAEFNNLTELPRFKSVLTSLAPCQMKEQRHFDFWVGEWTVTAAGQPYGGAKSRIESIQNGCAVLENYTAGNFAGTSINFFDPKRKVWHQSWMSNTGNVFYAEGGLNEKGEMVLTDADHEIAEVSGTINKVTWTPLLDGRVRQHWQASNDGGTSWQTVFDGYYSRVDEER